MQQRTAFPRSTAHTRDGVGAAPLSTELAVLPHPSLISGSLSGIFFEVVCPLGYPVAGGPSFAGSLMFVGRAVNPCVALHMPEKIVKVILACFYLEKNLHGPPSHKPYYLL